jgi:hypothetical protein
MSIRQMTREEYEREFGVAPSATPTQQTHSGKLQKTSKILGSIFGGQKLGEGIGTSIAATSRLLQGDKQGYQDILQTQVTPKEVAGDLLKIGSTVGAMAAPVSGTIPGAMAKFGAVGAASGAGKALVEGEGIEDVAEQALKQGATSAAIGGAFGVAGKGLSQFSKLLGKSGDKIQTSVIKPSLADIKDGFSLDTVKKYNLGGSLKTTFEKTDKTLDTLSKQLNQKLESSNASVDMNKAYDATVKKLLGKKLESFGANSQMEGAIEKLRGEIIGVSGKNGLVSIPEAQIIKRASGHFGAWSYGVPTPEATATQKVYNTFYNELKTAIEKGSPEGVKAVNQEISKLIPVMNALIRRIPVAERNSALSLTDIISLTGAALDPRALSVSLINLASKSGTVGAALSKTPDAGALLQKTEPVARMLAK